ncbi:ParA family protein [Testudinibacter sp. P27/CKL/0425]
MKMISLFNNKGGVGKSTLAFHLAHILSAMGHKTLIIDLDPQCNLTIFAMEEEELHKIWEDENDFIEDLEQAKKNTPGENYNSLLKSPRTIHFLLKPAEDGLENFEPLPPPIEINKNLGLIPGRLTVNQYESKISERWNGLYRGEPLSIRTVTNIRAIAESYSEEYNYDFVIVDTSPSLGDLNKVIISTVDGFIIPALPDMFSLYGIRNIGNSLKLWKKEFDTIYGLISTDKRKRFPRKFVRFLGYTIYNAKKYSKEKKENNGNNENKEKELARAHEYYAQQIPKTIEKFISIEVREHLSDTVAHLPIGRDALMYSHNTLPNMAQKYKTPMWQVPMLPNLNPKDKSTISGNKAKYIDTKNKYKEFGEDFLRRIEALD